MSTLCPVQCHFVPHRCSMVILCVSEVGWDQCGMGLTVLAHLHSSSSLSIHGHCWGVHQLGAIERWLLDVVAVGGGGDTHGVSSLPICHYLPHRCWRRGPCSLCVNSSTSSADEPWRMWYHPAIVNLFSIDNMLLAIISPTKVSIRVITDSCLLSKWFWKAFRALVPIHARRLRILGTTWIMNHEFLD